MDSLKPPVKWDWRVVGNVSAGDQGGRTAQMAETYWKQWQGLEEKATKELGEGMKDNWQGRGRNVRGRQWLPRPNRDVEQWDGGTPHVLDSLKPPVKWDWREGRKVSFGHQGEKMAQMAETYRKQWQGNEDQTRQELDEVMKCKW